MRVLIPAEAVAEKVKEIGARITRDYAGREPVLVCTLKGSFIFAADLARAIDLPLRMEFLRGESYGGGTVSPGEVRVTMEPDTLLTGRDVILIEDIVDTGRTAARLFEVLGAHKPASLRVCALLHKPARQIEHVPLDYLGFTIENVFVVGYGMDQGGRYRNLSFVGVP